MPAASNQIARTVRAQEVVPLPERQGIVGAKNPAVGLVRIRQAFLCAKIPVVLSPGLLATDLGQVVNHLAERKGAQEVKSVAFLFLDLNLQRVVG